MSIYPPAEDSFLLQKHLRAFAQGRVLDLGTGSGILALSAAQLSQVREVVAVDKNQEAIAALQKKIKEERLRKITLLESDLFSAVRGSFEVIFCNPPYLPQEKGVGIPRIHDETIYGGKKGWEFTEKFFHEVSRYLFSQGKILYLFSSLTNKKKVEDLMSNHLFSFQELDREKLAFEELYLYVVEKTPLLQELEKRGVENVCYLAHGKRGEVFRGIIDKNKFEKKSLFRAAEKILPVAIKVKRAESTAEGRIENEAGWLQILNVKGIGPRFIFSGKEFLVYQFVEGTPLMQWMETAEKKEILAVLQEVLRQCFILDQLGVNKEEMHRPLKHVLVDNQGYPWLIDFERCTATEKPKNVTQFLEFLRRIKLPMQEKNVSLQEEELTVAAKNYKQSLSKEAFQVILSLLR